jgi:hypothetical protein
LHADENKDEHVAQSQDVQVNFCDSFSPKTPITINTFEINKFSGNFMNGGGSTSITYNKNVTSLDLYFLPVLFIFNLFILE